jgi:O-antigen/teichoic acid export membrane protein
MVLSIGIAAALAAPSAIAVLLPQAYGDAADVVPWVALGAVFIGLYQIPMNHLTLVRGQTDRIWRATVASTAINVVLNLATVPRFGVMAAAVNTTIAYGVLMVLVRGYEHRRTGGALRPDASLACQYGAIVTTALVLGVCGHYALSGLTELIGELAVGTAVVCAAGLLYWRAEQSWTSCRRIA